MSKEDETLETSPSMEPNRKLELINHAVQYLSEEKKNQTLDDAEYQLALSRLFSELKMLKGEGALEQSEASVPTEVVPCATEKTENKNVRAGEEDDIVRELKKLKRQNFITHCLLSVMIVLTLTWQISEASLVFKVTDGLTHPFRAFGSLFTGMFKVPDKNGQSSEDKNEHQNQSESILPDMPHVNIPNLGSNFEE